MPSKFLYFLLLPNVLILNICELLENMLTIIISVVEFQKESFQLPLKIKVTIWWKGKEAIT